MIANLKPYTKMKDSGALWLGNVPEHWRSCKLRNILREITARNRSDLPLLSVVREKGVILRDITNKEENRNFIPDDLRNYKIVRFGQFAMNKMKAWQGSYGVSSYDGIVSPAYFVFYIYGVGKEYFHITIRSKAYIPFFNQASDGIRIGQWDLSKVRMREIPFFVPPLPDQAAIVRFIEYYDRKIKRYISAKQKLIKLLEEQKQAIINNAVKGKIDVRTGKPYPKYKPSGVEWLGDVPDHWEVRKLSSVCSLIVDGTHFSPKSDTTGDYLYITAKNIKEHGIETSNASYISSSDHETIFRKCPVSKGDVLYIKDGATAGIAIINDLEDEFSILSSIALIRSKKEILCSEYLSFLLNEYSFKKYVKSYVVGGAMTRFTVEIIKRFTIIFPQINEQDMILEFLNLQIFPFQSTRIRIEREISLLREYRTRLISDVVTGKLDVREAAANLPENEAETEPIDEEDTLDENVEDGENESEESAGEEGE